MRHMQPSNPTNHSSGYTLVELLVAIVVLPLIIVSFIFVIFTTFDSTTKSKTQYELSTNAQSAMQIIERDVRLATSFKTTIASPYSDTNIPNGASSWSYAGVPASATSRALILSVPSTTLAGTANTRGPVYSNVAANGFDCNTKLTYNPQINYTVIYFVQNGSLYRRILTDVAANGGTPRCAGNGDQIQKQSCPVPPPNYNSSLCKANDEMIAANVNNFSIDYYKALAITPIPNIYNSGADPTLVTTADDVSISLTLSRSFGGNPINGNTTLRIGKINQGNP